MAKWVYLILLACFIWQTDAPIAAQNRPPVSDTLQVVLDADTIFVDEVDDTVIAEGNVEATYDGRIMRADRLVYNRTSQKVRASGNVVIIDPDGNQRFADEIETDSTLSDGYAIGFSARLANGGLAVAESAVRTKDGYNALERILYSSCEMCEGETTPTWSLRARRAVLDEQAQMMSYRDAVLEIAGIPVLYLPWFAHPDPRSERRSGFLAPDFGTSSKLGLFYQQPYYWAISPYQDLTVSPLVTANVNPLMEVGYRKRFWSGNLKADFSFTREKDFDSDGEKFGESEWRGHIFAQGDFAITPQWRWGFGLEQVSDDLYTRRYDISGTSDKRGLYEGQPLRLLSQAYLIGQDRDWYADTVLLSLSGLRANDDDDKLPRALPVGYAERLLDFGDLGLVGLNTSNAILNREDGIDSYRLTLGADWDATQVLPGGVLFNPFAETRYDYYYINDIEAPSSAPEEEIHRAVATAGMRVSYPLVRPGKSVDIIIEPEGMAVYSTPGFNDPRIPVEDSSFFEFDESALFEANTVSGYDVYETGARASLGLSATARWKNGVELKFLGGRRWRDTADPIFDPASNLDGTVSDWVTGASISLGDPLTLETRLRLSSEDLALNRIDTRLKSKWWRLDSQVRYYKISSQINSGGIDDEGIDIRGQLQLTDNYFFVYERQRDISGRLTRFKEKLPGRDLSHKLGVAYADDCSRFEVVFERSEAVDRTLGPNDSVKFRFSFKTLGNFGSNDVD